MLEKICLYFSSPRATCSLDIKQEYLLAYFEYKYIANTLDQTPHLLFYDMVCSSTWYFMCRPVMLQWQTDICMHVHVCHCIHMYVIP